MDVCRSADNMSKGISLGCDCWYLVGEQICEGVSKMSRHVCEGSYFDLVWRWMSCMNKVHSIFCFKYIRWFKLPWATFALIASSSIFSDSEAPMILRYVVGPINQTKTLV